MVDRIQQFLFYSNFRRTIDRELCDVLNKFSPSERIKDILLYHFGFIDNNTSSTLSHSKRFRSNLCLLIADCNGHDMVISLPSAITLELIHNSTLIIDDIQDNDSLRCGRESLWKRYGLAEAVNIAFFLFALSELYYILHSVYNKTLHNFYYYKFQYIRKMFAGQHNDLYRISYRLDVYKDLVIGKTGSLINLALISGYFGNNEINTMIAEDLTNFANLFSILYQIQDDIEDIVLAVVNSDFSHVDNSNIIYYTNNCNNKTELFSITDIKKKISLLINYIENQAKLLRVSLNKLYRKKIFSDLFIKELFLYLALRNVSKLKELL